MPAVDPEVGFVDVVDPGHASAVRALDDVEGVARADGQEARDLRAAAEIRDQLVHPGVGQDVRVVGQEQLLVLEMAPHGA